MQEVGVDVMASAEVPSTTMSEEDIYVELRRQPASLTLLNRNQFRLQVRCPWPCRRTCPEHLCSLQAVQAG